VLDRSVPGAKRRHSPSECAKLAVSESGCESKDIVFVVPPFASPDWPSLGVHLLAAIAEQKGFTTGIIYGNLSFARLVGPKLYRSLCVTKTGDLVGERIFRNAYSRTRDFPGDLPMSWGELNEGNPPEFTSVQRLASEWAIEFAAALAETKPKLVGFSTTFEQTLSCLSVIEQLKAHTPDITVILGGANTDGTMGPALREFEGLIDHVFVGESDSSFAEFIDGFFAGDGQAKGIIQGHTNDALDELPRPDFETFFRQFNALVRSPACEDGLDGDELRIVYETSRGCWWGAKHHCTFCGLNANGMNHRIKSPEKVFDDVFALSKGCAVNKVIMVDNIMPFPYFSTLLPQLAEAEDKLQIFYEQKSNISLEKMRLLSAAGIKSIQPGIESLSSNLLKLMKKGVSAKTNIDCMRFARSCGVDVVWNVLADFPGDSETSYSEMIELMPLLHHLAPPTGVSTVSIDRFSPYHNEPEAHGIENLKPIGVYSELFPGADTSRLAYHFEGDYQSAARRRPDLLNRPGFTGDY